MCKEYHFDSLSGLEIDTWCGNVDANSSPVTICDINDNSKPTHFVQIRNGKTLNRKVLVTGIIQKKRAKFEGDPLVVTDTQWQREVIISGKRGLDTELLTDATIRKKIKGAEQIKVEVHYYDHWDPNLKWRADNDDLEFRVNLV